MTQLEITVELEYAIDRLALTDQPETIAGFALGRPASVEKLVGEEALARQMVELIDKVGTVPPFGPAVRGKVLAIEAPDEGRKRRQAIKVRAKTWQARHCKCPNCGSDHLEGAATHSGLEPHFDEAWVEFIVAPSALISLWDDYVTGGYENVFHGEDWGDFPY